MFQPFWGGFHGFPTTKHHSSGGWSISICASKIFLLSNLADSLQVLPSFAVATPVHWSQQVLKPASLPTKPVGSVKQRLTSSLRQLHRYQAPLPLHRRAVAPGAVEWCDDSLGASHPCSWVKLWATSPADGYHGGWIWVGLDGCWW